MSKILSRINFKARIKNKVYVMQLIATAFFTILAYAQMTPADLNSWSAVFDLGKSILGNPYILGLMLWSFFSATTDPTTNGIGDSLEALNYEVPKAKLGG